jgi:uncharacterized protein YceH (UPF0502 family)
MSRQDATFIECRNLARRLDIRGSVPQCRAELAALGLRPAGRYHGGQGRPYVTLYSKAKAERIVKQYEQRKAEQERLEAEAAAKAASPEARIAALEAEVARLSQNLA